MKDSLGVDWGPGSPWLLQSWPPGPQELPGGRSHIKEVGDDSADCRVSFRSLHTGLVHLWSPVRLAPLLPDSRVAHKSDGLRPEAQRINCTLRSGSCDDPFISVPVEHRETEMHGHSGHLNWRIDITWRKRHADLLTCVFQWRR